MTPEEIEELKTVSIPMQAKVQAIFDGTCVLHDLIQKSVIPLVVGMIQRTDHEDAIAGSYYRMFAWLKSLTELKNPIHIQAVCSAARSMFELLLDIKQLVPDPALAEKYHDFTFVRRFRSAKLTVEHYDKAHGVDPTRFAPERAFIGDPARQTKCDALRLKHWGRNSKHKLIWPDHWNNVDAASRARQVGSIYEDIHREAYQPVEITRFGRKLRGGGREAAVGRRSRRW